MSEKQGQQQRTGMSRNITRTLHIVLCLELALAAVVLTACGGNQTTVTSEVASTAGTRDVAGASPEGELDGGVATATSEVVIADDAGTGLDSGYGGALDAGTRLALGTLLLEETDQPLAAEQARQLLPLWQALQGGVTAEAEVNAVIAGIKQAMTPDQLASIADMALTQNDVEVWMQDRGVAFGLPDGSGAPAGERPTDGEGRAGMANMSEEEREAMRATIQAGGGMPGGGGGAAGGAGQYAMLLRPLIAMLEARAGEA
jgi:hypothetical protein